MHPLELQANIVKFEVSELLRLETERNAAHRYCRSSKPHTGNELWRLKVESFTSQKLWFSYDSSVNVAPVVVSFIIIHFSAGPTWDKGSWWLNIDGLYSCPDIVCLSHLLPPQDLSAVQPSSLIQALILPDSQDVFGLTFFSLASWVDSMDTEGNLEANEYQNRKKISKRVPRICFSLLMSTWFVWADLWQKCIFCLVPCSDSSPPPMESSSGGSVSMPPATWGQASLPSLVPKQILFIPCTGWEGTVKKCPADTHYDYFLQLKVLVCICSD